MPTSKSPAKPKIVGVRDKVNDTVTYVKSARKGDAVAHVTGNQFDVFLPTQEELVELGKKGVQIVDLTKKDDA